MRKLLSVFLAGCLLLLLPATIWASAETTYESEQGQAMIKAPSTASPNASANTEADVDSSDDSEGTLSPPVLPQAWTGLPQTRLQLRLPVPDSLPSVLIRDIREAG